MGRERREVGWGEEDRRRESGRGKEKRGRERGKRGGGGREEAEYEYVLCARLGQVVGGLRLDPARLWKAWHGVWT